MSKQTITGSAEPSLDFRALFESAPGLNLVLTVDLKIVAVSDTYLRATMTQRQAILGHGIFEVFPDNPDDPTATGVGNLRTLWSGCGGIRPRMRWRSRSTTFAAPKTEGGGFEDRYWSPVNSPVLGPDGEVDYIIHRVEDVTEFVQLKRQGVKQEKLAQEMHVRREQMEAEIFLRRRSYRRPTASYDRPMKSWGCSRTAWNNGCRTERWN